VTKEVYMFKGHFVNSINDKGRLSIPSRFRDELEGCGTDKLVITKGIDSCLVAYSPEEWEKVEEKASHLSSYKPAGIFYKRHVIGSADECVIDAQGRILVHVSLRDYAGLKNKCLFVGITDRFEIWNHETYERIMKEALVSPGDLHEELAKLGL
jgi:MraZ protein